MRPEQTGPALVLVYANGTLAAAAYHEHDGGEAYMAPLLRQAVRYARTHYDDGDILQVLLAEEEMRKVTDPQRVLKRGDVRHLYAIAYRWDAARGRKAYTAYARHLQEGERLPKVPDARELEGLCKPLALSPKRP